MRTTIVAIAALAACTPAPDQTNLADNGPTMAPVPARVTVAAPMASTVAVRAMPSPAVPPARADLLEFPPAPGTPGGLPDDRTPIAEHAPDTDGARAAYGVVEAYVGALTARNRARALALWRDPATGGDAVAAALAAREYHANIGGAGRVDAGAGQRHVSFRIQPYGVDAAGKRFAMIGLITLHRTADILGATADQRAWRISGFDVERTR